MSSAEAAGDEPREIDVLGDVVWEQRAPSAVRGAITFLPSSGQPLSERVFGGDSSEPLQIARGVQDTGLLYDPDAAATGFWRLRAQLFRRLPHNFSHSLRVPFFDPSWRCHTVVSAAVKRAAFVRGETALPHHSHFGDDGEVVRDEAIVALGRAPAGAPAQAQSALAASAILSESRRHEKRRAETQRALAADERAGEGEFSMRFTGLRKMSEAADAGAFDDAAVGVIASARAKKKARVEAMQARSGGNRKNGAPSGDVLFDDGKEEEQDDDYIDNDDDDDDVDDNDDDDGGDGDDDDEGASGGGGGEIDALVASDAPEEVSFASAFASAMESSSGRATAEAGAAAKRAALHASRSASVAAAELALAAATAAKRKAAAKTALKAHDAAAARAQPQSLSEEMTQAARPSSSSLRRESSGPSSAHLETVEITNQRIASFQPREFVARGTGVKASSSAPEQFKFGFDVGDGIAGWEDDSGPAAVPLVPASMRAASLAKVREDAWDSALDVGRVKKVRGPTRDIASIPSAAEFSAAHAARLERQSVLPGGRGYRKGGV